MDSYLESIKEVQQHQSWFMRLIISCQSILPASLGHIVLQVATREHPFINEPTSNEDAGASAELFIIKVMFLDGADSV